MSWNGLFQGGDFRALRAGLEASWRASQEVDHNLVNAETPGFQARDTDFKSLLLETPGALPKGEGFDLYLRDLEPPQPFDLERELARLSRVSLENEAAGNVLQRRYSDLRFVIREGH